VLTRWYAEFGHALNNWRQRQENKYLPELLLKKTPILVYQMGKVGSSSIYWPLKKLYSGAVLHAHNLRSDHYAQEVHILRDYLKDDHAPIILISLARDPIARNISAFFQSFKKFVGCRPDQYKGSVEQLLHIFIDDYHHHIPHEWFQKRMLQEFEINIYDHILRKDKTLFIEKGPVKTLVMRQDITDELKEKYVRDITGLPTFQLERKNRAEDKSYAELYSSFKKLPLPEDYVQEQLSTQYSNYFFTEQERDAMMKKWSKKDDL